MIKTLKSDELSDLPGYIFKNDWDNKARFIHDARKYDALTFVVIDDENKEKIKMVLSLCIVSEDLPLCILHAYGNLKELIKYFYTYLNLIGIKPYMFIFYRPKNKENHLIHFNEKGVYFKKLSMLNIKFKEKII